MANILLLSMSLYNRVLSEHYYTAGNEKFFFCGVSQLEVGTKYFLRKLQKHGKKLDKIIIIESHEVRNETKDVSRWFKQGDRDYFIEMTASEFYRARVIQYINGQEECIESVSGLTEKVAEYEERAVDEPSFMELYSNPEDLFEIVEMGIGDSAVYECIKKVCERIKDIASNDEKTNLYLDMQGARRYETFAINTVVKMLEVCDVKVKESVAVDFAAGNTKNGIANKIVDTTDNNIILEMVSGMNEFIKTGRGDTLREFWQNCKRIPGIKKDSVVTEIIKQIRQISDAISLCDVESFDSNLVDLKQIIEDYEKSDDSEKQPLFQTFVIDLKEDYFGHKHDLLPSDDRMKVINQIRWCVDKKLYQQALALVEEKIPENLVNNHILYYDDKEKLNLLINEMIKRGYECPDYLRNGKYQVKEEKAAHIWIGYIMECRSDSADWTIDVKKKYERFMPATKLNEPVILPKTEKEIGDLLKRYGKLKEQRNKVMHATAENYNVSTIKSMLVEFANKYEALIESQTSYDFSLKRPMC